MTGVSVRTLHHYHSIGLLLPTRITEAGYRLYDACALEKLYKILLFREAGFSLEEIKNILCASDDARNGALAQQIRLLEQQVEKLQNRITLAKGIQITGGKYMDFEEFDAAKLDDYSTQAKALYGKTEAYREYTRKSKNRSDREQRELGEQVMEFFARLGKLRPCDPGCAEAQAWAKELQDFFTANYYTCTPQILSSLAESYAGGGSMTENIDKAGGAGTGTFAKEVIDHYIQNNY